jgi:RNA polymerase sigma factor (sigma-70 family)
MEVVTTGEAEVPLRRSLDEELYRRHISAAIRFGYFLTGDRAAGEDLAHEAFLRCAPRVTSLRSPDRFAAYLRRAMVRGTQAQARSVEREAGRIERASRLGPVADEADGVVGRLDMVVLLDRLPVRQRAALALRFGADCSESEIAKALRCRPGTVKSLVSRGLAALREEVDRDG